MKIRMLFPILCLFSKIQICQLNQDEFVDHQVRFIHFPDSFFLSLLSQHISPYLFLVIDTRSEVETFNGVLNELNNVQPRRPPPPPQSSSRGVNRPVLPQRLPPPPPPTLAVHGGIRLLQNRHPPPPPIPARNPRS